MLSTILLSADVMRGFITRVVAMYPAILVAVCLVMLVTHGSQIRSAWRDVATHRKTWLHVLKQCAQWIYQQSWLRGGVVLVSGARIIVRQMFRLADIDSARYQHKLDIGSLSDVAQQNVQQMSDYLPLIEHMSGMFGLWLLASIVMLGVLLTCSCGNKKIKNIVLYGAICIGVLFFVGVLLNTTLVILG